MKKLKKKKPCAHPAWKVKRTDKGLKRTCTSCGMSITEVAQGVFGNPTNKKLKRHGKK